MSFRPVSFARSVSISTSSYRMRNIGKKTWRAARVMALESGAAPRAPMWPPAPRAAAACRSRWWRLRPVPQPQAGPVSPPACGRRAASRAHGQPPGAGLGRRPEARGTAGCGGGASGDATGKGLYISYTPVLLPGRLIPPPTGATAPSRPPEQNLRHNRILPGCRWRELAAGWRDTTRVTAGSRRVVVFQEAHQSYRCYQTLHLSLQPDESCGVERALHGVHYRPDVRHAWRRARSAR